MYNSTRKKSHFAEREDRKSETCLACGCMYVGFWFEGSSRFGPSRVAPGALFVFVVVVVVVVLARHGVNVPSFLPSL